MGKGIIKSGGDRGVYTIDIEYRDGSTEERSAWCADLTEDFAAGDVVSTAEIPGDTRIIQIMPGYKRKKSQYSSERSGQMVKAENMPVTAVWLNKAIYPAWQKWKPTLKG